MPKVYSFECGCVVPIDESLPPVHGHPSLMYSPDSVPRTCSLTFDLISSGNTKGVFQLESPLGRQWAKKLKPGVPDTSRGIEHLAALGALLRPGCVSGDSTVMVKFWGSRRKRNLHARKIKLRTLFQKFHRNHNLLDKTVASLDESGLNFFNNELQDVFYSGEKDVYRPIFQLRKRPYPNEKFFNLECTLDHQLLTHDGSWVALQDLIPGERVAVLNRRCRKSRATKNHPGEKTFQSACFYAYQYNCVFCDWREASLDVNHLDGNRRSNNDPANLCYMCPNHHKMYTEGKISKEEVILAREKYVLRPSDHIQWAVYRGKEYVGKKDTYDITVKGPNHNFIAGNVVVHNCLRAKDEDGVSMTERYCLRKNGEEETSYYHPSLEAILNKTYGVLVYQEQAMAIATVLAGFTLAEADDLRKAIGKKKTDVMAKVKTLFIERAAELGRVTSEEAAEIFGWIEKSQRYSFNASHAVSYAYIGYYTAWLKAHFPVQFYTSYLYHAQEKQDPLLEIRQLVNDARTFGFEVLPPRFEDMKCHFNLDRQGIVITFGLSDVKGIGTKHIMQMRDNVRRVEEEVGQSRMTWDWYKFLTWFSPACPSNVVKRMIEVGGLRSYGLDRQRMLAEYDVFSQLTEREQHLISTLREDKLDRDGFRVFKGVEVGNLRDAIKALLEVPKGVATAKRKEKVASLLKLLECPPRPLDDTPEWIAKTEEECLGIPITCSRVEGIVGLQADTTCKEFREGKAADRYVLAVDVQEYREHRIQKGDNIGKKMAFLVVGDQSGSLDDVCMFSEAWEKYGNMIYEGATVEIRGRKDSRRGSLIVEEVFKI